MNKNKLTPKQQRFCEEYVIDLNATQAAIRAGYAERRIDLVVGISYGSPIDKAYEIMKKIVASDSRILAEPEVTIAVAELADSSVNFVLRPWVRKEDYWAVRFDLIEKIKKEFDSAGIEIPFPQSDVHLYRADKA